MRRSALLVAAALLTFLLSSCAGGDDSPTVSNKAPGGDRRSPEGHGRTGQRRRRVRRARLQGQGEDGEPAIAEKAHVRLAHPDQNHGAKLLRRGYNFVDGSNCLGQPSAGLFFTSYQRDPVKQFVQVQRRLAGTQNDVLNEYIVHVGSGLFACLPGVGPKGFWGEGLLAGAD